MENFLSALKTERLAQDLSSRTSGPHDWVGLQGCRFYLAADNAARQIL